MNTINEFYKNKYPNIISLDSEKEITRMVEMMHNRYKKSVISKQETAEETGLSVSTIDRLRAEGSLRSKKIGGRIFFTLYEVAYFIVEVCDEY